MAITAMSAIFPYAEAGIADPVDSAWRITTRALPPLTTQWASGATGGWLLSAQNATGTGTTLTALANGGGYGAGYYQVMCTGNSASAQFLVSRDGTKWIGLTSTAVGAGTTTGTGQWSGYYPYIAAQVTWVSGAATTGTVWVSLDLM